MRNKNLPPQGGNYVLYDIYLIQQRGEDTAAFFHLLEGGNVTCVCFCSLII